LGGVAGRSGPAAVEFRGSSIVERFIEAADPNLPDFATAGDAVVDTAYKVRVLATKKFAP
jgi:hypothetical protein